MDWDEEIDAVGLLCPLPVLRAAKRLRALAPGKALLLKADDPAAVVDVPHFCAEQGYNLVRTGERDGVAEYLIRKPSRPGGRP
ncbi:MAG: sulfurtransferase TusA family protein [Pseudomonadota bacterium]